MIVLGIGVPGRGAVTFVLQPARHPEQQADQHADQERCAGERHAEGDDGDDGRRLACLDGVGNDRQKPGDDDHDDGGEGPLEKVFFVPLLLPPEACSCVSLMCQTPLRHATLCEPLHSD